MPVATGTTKDEISLGPGGPEHQSVASALSTFEGQASGRAERINFGKIEQEDKAL